MTFISAKANGGSSAYGILLSKNFPYTEEKGQDLLQKKEALFKEIVQDRFIPGTRRFVKSLVRSGLQLSLVTGTARHELNRILPLPLRQLFEVIITADDVKIGKPDPEPYLCALANLGIAAHEAVVIENAPFGIQSAKAAMSFLARRSSASIFWRLAFCLSALSIAMSFLVKGLHSLFNSHTLHQNTH